MSRPIAASDATRERALPVAEVATLLVVELRALGSEMASGRPGVERRDMALEHIWYLGAHAPGLAALTASSQHAGLSCGRYQRRSVDEAVVDGWAGRWEAWVLKMAPAGEVAA